MSALDALTFGRSRLLAENWGKKAHAVQPHSYCAVTALRGKGWEEARDTLHEVALSMFPERLVHGGEYPVIDVNDHPDTTFNDVMAMYDEAERILKERANA